MDLVEAEKMLKVATNFLNLISQLVPAAFTLHLDQIIRDYIEQEKLGTILYFHADYQTNTKLTLNSKLNCRHNNKYSGKNTMVLGIIYQSILRWIPPAKKVRVIGNIFNNKAINSATEKLVNVKIPDYISIQMEMENGIKGSMLLSEVNLHPPSPYINIIGTEGSLLINLTQ